MKDEIFSLPTLREVTKKLDFSADKKLGQHFIFDLNITDKIVRTAGDISDCTVIEVGPGPGGLTRSLLAAGAKKVIAIDKDPRSLMALSSLKNIAGERLEVIIADALKISETEIAEGKIKIIANLPYNVGTVLLFKWLDDIKSFRSLTLMLQKEVVDRITASPSTKDYGRLSVMVQWLCEADKVFDVPPDAFVPPPKVYSSVVHIRPRAKPLYAAERKTMEKLCQAVFGQRRKMLRGSLKQLTKEPSAILENAGISGELRPEELSISQFAALARSLDELA